MSLPIAHQALAGALFLAAAGLGLWLSGASEDGPVVPPVRPTRITPATPVLAPATVQALARTRPWPAPAEAALRAWGPLQPAAAVAAAKPTPPRAVAAPPAASAPPRAPAPGWRFVGRIADGAAVRAMLVTPQQLRVVAEQELIDADWRVERIGEQGVELLWLPGPQRVRLAWAAS